MNPAYAPRENSRVEIRGELRVRLYNAKYLFADRHVCFSYSCDLGFSLV